MTMSLLAKITGMTAVLAGATLTFGSIANATPITQTRSVVFERFNSTKAVTFAGFEGPPASLLSVTISFDVVS
jgi:hypothetical protein